MKGVIIDPGSGSLGALVALGEIERHQHDIGVQPPPQTIEVALRTNRVELSHGRVHKEPRRGPGIWLKPQVLAGALIPHRPAGTLAVLRAIGLEPLEVHYLSL